MKKKEIKEVKKELLKHLQMPKYKLYQWVFKDDYQVGKVCEVLEDVKADLIDTLWFEYDSIAEDDKELIEQVKKLNLLVKIIDRIKQLDFDLYCYLTEGGF